MIVKVLIGNGSALNILLRHVLDKMLIDDSYIKSSTMTMMGHLGQLLGILTNY